LELRRVRLLDLTERLRLLERICSSRSARVTKR
jgi:hypothetical protein